MYSEALADLGFEKPADSCLGACLCPSNLLKGSHFIEPAGPLCGMTVQERKLFHIGREDFLLGVGQRSRNQPTELQLGFESEQADLHFVLRRAKHG